MPAVMRTVVDVVAAVALVCGAASARSLPSFRSADRLIGWSEEYAPLLCAAPMCWLAEGSALVGFRPATVLCHKRESATLFLQTATRGTSAEERDMDRATQLDAEGVRVREEPTALALNCRGKNACC